MTAATAATVATARAVVILMARSATVYFLSPGNSAQCVHAAPGQEPLGKHQRRDGLVAVWEPGPAGHPPQGVEPYCRTGHCAVDFQRHVVVVNMQSHGQTLHCRDPSPGVRPGTRPLTAVSRTGETAPDSDILTGHPVDHGCGNGLLSTGWMPGSSLGVKGSPVQIRPSRRFFEHLYPELGTKSTMIVPTWSSGDDQSVQIRQRHLRFDHVFHDPGGSVAQFGVDGRVAPARSLSHT